MGDYTFGVYNEKTKELFCFEDDYRKALFAYWDLIKENMVGFLFPEEWYLVYIRDGFIVQTEQFSITKKCTRIAIDKDSFIVHNGGKTYGTY